MEYSVNFSDVARRLGAAARAAGLIAPAFRSPPRTAACRTIRRLPGGPVVAVRMRGRPFDAVVLDMVDGVIAANRLEGRSAARVHAALVRAVGLPLPEQSA